MTLFELRMMFPLMPQEQMHCVARYLEQTTRRELTEMYHDFKTMGIAPDRAIALAEVLTRPPELPKKVFQFTADYLCNFIGNGNGGYYALARHVKETIGASFEPMSPAEMSSVSAIQGWEVLSELLNARINRMRQEGKV